MTKIILIFGLGSGLVLVLMLTILMPLCLSGAIDFENAELIGYASMLLAFLFVFFGVRSYRETHGGGAITFGRAFQVGILISLVACAVYVISWEIYYFNFDPTFADKYATFTIDKMRARGESAAAIAAMEKQMADFKKMYANPLINIGITFMEIFPVALVMTLVSAAILRRRTPPREEATVTA